MISDRQRVRRSEEGERKVLASLVVRCYQRDISSNRHSESERTALALIAAHMLNEHQRDGEVNAEGRGKRWTATLTTQWKGRRMQLGIKALRKG